MKLYYILYNGDENNPKHFEGITDNFDKWLEEHNSQRDEDSQEHAEDFEVEEIKLYLYENKNDDDLYKRAIEEALTIMRDVVEGYVGLEDVADEIEQEVKEQLLQ